MKEISTHPWTTYRRLWLPDGLAVLAAMLVTALAFETTDLDLLLLRPFCTPDADIPWPYGWRGIWPQVWKLADVAVIALALAGTVLLVGSFFHSRLAPWRVHGLFMLLFLVLGPGVLVNGVLKEHWGRPRPREVTEMGGAVIGFECEYRRISEPGTGNRGKSFPSGHAAAGFSVAALYLVGRRRKRRLRWTAAGLGLAVGGLVGVARMAAGGHYPSDVLFAGWLTFASAWVLYYPVLNVPGREDAAGGGATISPRGVLLAATTTGLIWLASLAVTPEFQKFDLAAELPDGIPHAVTLRGVGGTVRVDLVADSRDVELGGTATGMGWSSAALRPQLSAEAATLPDFDGLTRDTWVDVGVRLEGWLFRRAVDCRAVVPSEGLFDLTLAFDGFSIVELHGPQVPLTLELFDGGRVTIPPDWDTEQIRVLRAAAPVTVELRRH